MGIVLKCIALSTKRVTTLFRMGLHGARRNMRTCIILSSLFFISLSHATQQIPETFIVDGETFELKIGGDQKSPLESLYTFEKILTKLDYDGWCSGNWRGYKGTWEIKNKQLYLNSLVKDACSKNPPIVDPKLFFGDMTYPLKAEWFNSEIIIRLSPNRYLTKVEGAVQTEIFGSEYDAMVYEFSSGELISQHKKVIQKIWSKPLPKKSDSSDK